ncbi:hypothetical protein Ddye_029138 [Dipteronia dyeriana]|uniref:DUF4283 domain-containing protein n=1 Tax=Dipteronia dyeriana TaxID=168575 RepID=A0AAD9TE86_9ROSI|nr:hypothetical protein Ddye_029138 [Dipteronia dyeriana]
MEVSEGWMQRILFVCVVSYRLLNWMGRSKKLYVNLKTAALGRISLCLVAKVLSRKTVNNEAFIRVMGKVWQVKRGVVIESLTGNIFMLHFKKGDDRNRILSGNPWSFYDALIVLIPLICITRDIGWFLGEMIGEVNDLDGGSTGDCVGNFMRVRVRVAIDKPLRRCLRVDVLGDGVETIMILSPLRRNNVRDRRGLQPQEESNGKKENDKDHNSLQSQLPTTGAGKTNPWCDINGSRKAEGKQLVAGNHMDIPIIESDKPFNEEEKDLRFDILTTSTDTLAANDELMGTGKKGGTSNLDFIIDSGGDIGVYTDPSIGTQVEQEMVVFFSMRNAGAMMVSARRLLRMPGGEIMGSDKGITGSSVVSACLKVLNDGGSVRDLNNTVITLIPKRGNENKRKIHWCTWKHLCKEKSNGGLGFRDLEVFNKSLLAKQGWRIIKNLDSLASRTLKGCYFPNSSFLAAGKTSTGSFIWNSLLWGRGILDKRLRWRLGNGTSIRIYKDNWVSRPNTFKILSTPSLGDTTVDRLLSPSGGWDMQVLK